MESAAEHSCHTGSHSEATRVLMACLVSMSLPDTDSSSLHSTLKDLFFKQCSLDFHFPTVFDICLMSVLPCEVALQKEKVAETLILR